MMKNHMIISRLFNQSAAKTWQTFQNFHEVPVPGAIVTMEGENNIVGSVRTIHYPSGLTVKERLDAFVNSGPQYLFTYSFTEPMVGVCEYMGTWLVYPAGKDGKRSKMDMYLTWEPVNDEGNEAFEKVIVDLLQKVYLTGPDPKEE